MAQLDPNIPLQAFSQQRQPSMLDQLGQAAPIADFMQKQRAQEQLADIFGRNITRNHEGGLDMNRQNALAEVYAVQPQMGLEFEKGFASAQPSQSALNRAYQFQFGDVGEGPQLLRLNYAEGTAEPVGFGEGGIIRQPENISFRDVIGPNGEIITGFGSRTGSLYQTGQKPAEAPKRTADIAKTYEDIKTGKVEREKKTIDLAEKQEKMIGDVKGQLAGITQFITTIDDMIGSEDGKIKPHKGFKSAIGAKGAGGLFGLKSEPIAGTPSANFVNKYKMFQGKTFIDQYNALKGGGQITEVEGEKAEKALTDMDRSQSESEFRKSARVLQKVLKDGWQRKKEQIQRLSKINPAFGQLAADRGITPQQEAAMKWANENPNDPRSAAILKKLGLVQ